MSKNGVYCVDGKRGVSYGIDYIHPVTGQRVRKILKNVTTEAQAAQIRNIKRSKSEYVFCHLNGRPFKTNLYKVFKRAAERAGVTLPPRKAWHILRRTWASMFLQNGADLETLRELGNWKDYSMPIWYANAGNSEHNKKGLNKLSKLEHDRNLAEKGKVVKLTVSNN